MTREEKLLYHQIHPLKLLADWTAGFVALPLLWRHRLRAALLASFGRYMTREMQGVRLAGYLIMSLGAWHRRLWPVPLVVLFGWFRGMIFPRGG